MAELSPAELLNPENFDFDKVIALVDASEVSALKKTVLKGALEKAKDNPDLLKAAIDQIKAALKIEG